MTADLETRLQRAAEAHCPGLTLPRDLGLRLVAEVFASDGNEEDRWIEATQNACPACGGSGHKGDCAAPLGDAVAEINFLRAELATADDRAKDAHAVGFAAGIEAAAKTCDRIAGNTRDFWRDHRRAAGQCAALIRALTPPDITAEAARVLLADMENMKARPLADMVEAMLVEMHPAIALRGLCAALRALAEVKP